MTEDVLILCIHFSDYIPLLQGHSNVITLFGYTSNLFPYCVYFLGFLIGEEGIEHFSHFYRIYFFKDTRNDQIK